MTQPTPPSDAPETDLSNKEEEIFQVRLQKADELRKKGINPYGNGYAPRNTCAEIHAAHGQHDAAALEAASARYDLAGRVMAKRVAGKLIFIVLRDRTAQLQVMCRKNAMGDEAFEVLNKLTDVGDIVAVQGKAIRTKTGELSVDAEKLQFLTKSLRPLPEKWHGLSDIELRHRQRYVDLISNYPLVRDIFRTRTKIVRGIQKFLDARDFMEVETPMLHKPEEAGGAAARPFATHHNALDLDLKLRIATELHLKRLVVGGIERVYEVGRIFRNEGVDRKHNPEFTSVEFYWAYATYEDLITLTEDLLVALADEVLGKRELTYQGQSISLQKPFARVSMVTEVAKQMREFERARNGPRIYPDNLEALPAADQMLLIEKQFEQTKLRAPDDPVAESLDAVKGHVKIDTVGDYIAWAFEHYCEAHLPKDRPTFVTDFPLEISPLARRRDSEPRLTDRFELYLAGMEIANAFSELNDPVDQRQRFEKQMERKQKGDAEAMPFDEDFVRALEFGMPPTAGEGIGIDRLCMLFTDQPNIREVILFPLLKPLS